MGRAAIKVIKKNSQAFQSPAGEEKKTKSVSKKAIHSIEGNIKSWIEELHLRKNDELLHAQTFLGGI